MLQFGRRVADICREGHDTFPAGGCGRLLLRAEQCHDLGKHNVRRRRVPGQHCQGAEHRADAPGSAEPRSQPEPPGCAVQVRGSRYTDLPGRGKRAADQLLCRVRQQHRPVRCQDLHGQPAVPGSILLRTAGCVRVYGCMGAELRVRARVHIFRGRDRLPGSSAVAEHRQPERGGQHRHDHHDHSEWQCHQSVSDPCRVQRDDHGRHGIQAAEHGGRRCADDHNGRQ